MLRIPMKLRHFFCITAIGIHMISGSKPPMSSGVIALNSFVLPVHEVDVSQAPTRGLALMEKFIPTIRLILSKFQSIIKCENFNFILSACTAWSPFTSLGEGCQGSAKPNAVSLDWLAITAYSLSGGAGYAAFTSGLLISLIIFCGS